MQLRTLVEDKLREMLEAETINVLQQAYWQLDGMLLAGAPGDRKKAKETYYKCLDQLIKADDIPSINPVIGQALKPFLGGMNI